MFGVLEYNVQWVLTMTQEYKNNPLSLSHLIVYGGGAAIQLAVVYVLVLAPNRALWWEIPIYLGGVALVGFFQYLAWQAGKTIVVTAEDRLILRQFNKTVEARWDEINRIEDVWSFYGGSRSYCVRTPHGIIGIPDTIERCEELLAIIQERSGKRIISEWRGTKDSLREEWQALVRWIRTHQRVVLLLVVMITALSYAAIRWAIQEGK